LFANQRAVLDKRTGSIRVFKNDNLTAVSWLKGELVFHATPILNVFRSIERSYGIKIHLTQPNFPDNDLFTGTFSTDNLYETLNILKMHYRFDYTIQGKNVAIENFRLNHKKDRH